MRCEELLDSRPGLAVAVCRRHAVAAVIRALEVGHSCRLDSSSWPNVFRTPCVTRTGVLIASGLLLGPTPPYPHRHASLSCASGGAEPRGDSQACSDPHR